jgi:hypothetical protein
MRRSSPACRAAPSDTAAIAPVIVLLKTNTGRMKATGVELVDSLQPSHGLSSRPWRVCKRASSGDSSRGGVLDLA